MPTNENHQLNPTAQDWTALQLGDLVQVTEPTGFAYHAYIETKAEDSAVLWIRTADLGSRHLIDCLDSILVSPRQ